MLHNKPRHVALPVPDDSKVPRVVGQGKDPPGVQAVLTTVLDPGYKT